MQNTQSRYKRPAAALKESAHSRLKNSSTLERKGKRSPFIQLSVLWILLCISVHSQYFSIIAFTKLNLHKIKVTICEKKDKIQLQPRHRISANVRFFYMLISVCTMKYMCFAKCYRRGQIRRGQNV